MKKFLLILIIFSSIVGLSAKQITQKNDFEKNLTYSFTIEPIDMMQSYHGYMPGSFCSIPIREQADDIGAGTYFTFHAKETPNSYRRVFFAYLSSEGDFIDPVPINFQENSEAYPAIDIDSLTGDPFFVYHTTPEEGDSFNCDYAYDQFHFLNSPGFLGGPWNVINGEDIQNNPLDYLNYDYEDYNLAPDEFLWPYIYIGESPNDDKRRAFVTAKNYTEGAAGNPSGNIIIAYTDFEENDLNGNVPLSWNYSSIDFFDQMHLSQTWERAFQSFAVGEDGRAAFCGFKEGEEIDSASSDNFFIVYTENYGEDWTVIEKNISGNPSCPYVMENGDPVIPNTEISSQHFTFYAADHFNAEFDADNNLHLVSNYSLSMKFNNDDGYFIDPYLSGIKEIYHNFDMNETEVRDVYPRGIRNNEQMYTPWDLNEDGEIDDFDENGYPVVKKILPYLECNSTGNSASMNNNLKMSMNKEFQQIAIVWQDSYKATEFMFNDNPEYADYEDVPEIFIAISEDNGVSWSKPSVISSVDNEQMNDIIPKYVYPSEKIDYDGFYSKLKLMWFDADYYSDSMAPPPTDGGFMQFAEIQFEGEPDDDFAEVSGRVLNQSEEPIENANINIGSFSTVSDSEGLFSMNVPDQMMYEFSIQADGFQIYLEEEFTIYGDVDLGDIYLTSTTGNEVEQKLYLIGNFPNPFSISKNERDSGTTIKFSLIEKEKVRIEIYNLKGQKIKTLIDSAISAGKHSITWNGKNNKEQFVSSGIYFVKLKTQDTTSIKKMMLIK